LQALIVKKNIITLAIMW